MISLWNKFTYIQFSKLESNMHHLAGHVVFKSFPEWVFEGGLNTSMYFQAMFNFIIVFMYD